MSPEELETAISIPLETALAGLPGVRRVRSVSQLGVTPVTVEFEADANYYRSRQLVAERLAQVQESLPAGTEPPLISSLTGRLNEIIEITLEADPKAADLMTLRDIGSSTSRTACSPSRASPQWSGWAATCASSRCGSIRRA